MAEHILFFELRLRGRDTTVKSNSVEVSKTLQHYASELEDAKVGFRLTQVVFANTYF